MTKMLALLPLLIAWGASLFMRPRTSSPAVPNPNRPLAPPVAFPVFNPNQPLSIPVATYPKILPALPAPYVQPGAPPPMMQPAASNISENGLSFLKSQEGLKSRAYPDSAGNLTIGYGHKIIPGDGFASNSVISTVAADTLLRADIARSVNLIRSLVAVPLAQNQFDALASFVFNVGSGNFASSTLLKKLNARDYAAAAAEFARWIYAGGQPVLVSRRQQEASLFSATV